MGPLEDYLSAIFGDSCRELALHLRWALTFAKRVIIFSCSRAEAGSAAGDPCSGRIHYGPPAVAFINFFCREESQHDLDAGSKINSRGPKQFSKTPANDQNKKKNLHQTKPTIEGFTLLDLDMGVGFRSDDL
jgi:hypothetical protein